MAKCDEGYRCSVCGDDVHAIVHSDLYLRYVIGEVDPETLHTTEEKHILCNPSLAQFIVDPQFPGVVVEGDFDKRQMDPEFVRTREATVTGGWRRLQRIASMDAPIHEYPLPELRRKWE